MEKSKLNFRFGIIVLMIFVAGISRLIPHWWNFTPLGGMALFGAAYFGKKYWAFLIPLLALWMTDLFLNNVIYAQYYEGFVLMGDLWVYGSFLLIVLIGTFLLKKIRISNLFLASLSASAIFFIVSNFGTWLSSPMLYPKTITGLMLCYEAAIPFFWSTLTSDLFYTAVLFGSFEWVQRRYFSVQVQRQTTYY